MSWLSTNSSGSSSSQQRESHLFVRCRGVNAFEYHRAAEEIAAFAKLVETLCQPPRGRCVFRPQMDQIDGSTSSRIESPYCRLAIHMCKLYLDGELVALETSGEGTENALKFLASLIRAYPYFKSGTDIAKDHALPIKFRWDRTMQSLPVKVKSLIESGGPKGYRIKPPH